MKDDPNLTIFEGGMNLVQALYLNNAQKPFDDVKVRQAMCYAVNRQEVLDMMADGKGTIIGSSMFPAFEKYICRNWQSAILRILKRQKNF